jgi:LuxR family transcriptional regulator, maltose regulon positive regulatory protein
MATTRGQRDTASDASLTPILRARLHPPQIPDHYVRRSRLVELLDDDVARASLTLVVAPAGAGKTLTLAGWAAESSTATAWLSLDDSDRDAVQLWMSLTAALEALAPGCGPRTRGVLYRGMVSEAVDRLVADLQAQDRPRAALVIEDLHLVDDDDAVTASLTAFLPHLPPWLHVVISSRRQPKLPLNRMRGRGHLGEIHFSELRFSHEESKELLARLSPTMPEEARDAAADRADGWAASLQLAALTARSARAQAGLPVLRPGEDVLVHDYVVHEVLASEKPDLVDGLLDMSVVDRVNSDLAAALTGRSDAGDLLTGAEERGLFVSRLDSRGWFEIHSLVRAALVAELGSRSEDRLAEQHVRAAQWLEQVGEVPLALEHLLLAGRPRQALRLLAATHDEMSDSGREAAIRRTIEAIPGEVATADLASLIEFAWCHRLVNRGRFVEIVDQATWWADRSPLDEPTRRRLTILQADAAFFSGSWTESGRLGREALSLLGDSWWRDNLGRYAWNMVARATAHSESWDDTSDELREAELALGRDPRIRASFEGTRALGEALAGRPTDALRVAAGVRGAVEVSNRTVLRTELQLAEALAYREIGDRKRAMEGLKALSEAPAETMLVARVLATLELAQAHLDDNAVDPGLEGLRRAERLIDSESLGRDIRAYLARVATLILVTAGDVESARGWAAEVEDPFWGGVCTARVELAVGNRPGAAAALEGVIPRCLRHEVVLGLLKARATDNHEAAAKTVAMAIELAASNGLMQTIASEGPEVLELVELGAWRAPESWMARLRRAAAARSSASSQRDLAEPLTQRELDILRFLPSRLTLREIASELYVSVNTLKFHLKVIYRKLGVNSRADAAAKARELLVKRAN